jgi:hypothetical protein
MIWLIVSAAILAGCAAQQPIVRIPFPEAEYAALPKTGTGVVRGQAFLKTRGGDVKLGAGNRIVLNPVTSYSQQWYQTIYEQGKPIEEPDLRVQQYLRETTGDAEGRFEFKDVPPGDYFVITVVTWEAPVGYRGSLVSQGGYVIKRVTVRDGQEQQVILTR